MLDIKRPSLVEVVIITVIVGVFILVMRVGSKYQSLVEENSVLSEQTAALSSKNDSLIKSVDNLATEVKTMNGIVATESRRRAAAEMKIQRLQEEVKYALKASQCAAEPVPDVADVRVREAANDTRRGKAAPPADTSKSAD